MKSTKFKIIGIYDITILIAVLILYYIIPIFLNYGPGTINTNFDRTMSGGLLYYQQLLVAAFALVVLITIVLLWVLRDFDNYPKYKLEFINNNNENSKKKLDKIIKTCFTLPNYVFVACLVVPIALELLLLFGQTYTSSSDFKLVLIVFIVSTIAVSIDNIYVKKIFSKILIALNNNSLPSKRGKLLNRLLLQIVPILAVGIVFTFLAISSVYEQNKGVLLSEYYVLKFKSILNNSDINDYDDLVKELKNVELSRNTDILFVTDTNFNYLYTSGELSYFFKEYSKEYSLKNNNLVYDYYGTYGQGVIYPINLNGNTFYLGAHYLIYTPEMFGYMLLYIIIIFIICLIILAYFSRELCKDINSVENSLESIYKNKKINEDLYVTSNDELGNIVISVNKIQKLNRDQIKKIENNQSMLMEQERLASLGQLIGGISHNLKTPIMSISGAAEGLTDLITELDKSIGDPEVTNDDFHAIATDMKDWITKIHSYTGYMSDIITAVKGQAVTLSESEQEIFTIDELIKRVSILMKNELQNGHAELNTQLNGLEKTTIHGNVNSLVQVINNLITNAIQSYREQPGGTINLVVKKSSVSQLIISIEDHGCGIPKDVQDKLFKEMITTKGKNGTGLGMFMSYSTIKGKFKGDMTFTSKEGYGTKFSIVLPL